MDFFKILFKFSLIIIDSRYRLPHKFFTPQVKGLLRCVWATQDDDWVDLPGPAEWWPDDSSYYRKHGLEIRADQKENHRKALEMLGAIEAPVGWMEACVHEGNPFDLIWNKYF